MSMIHWLFISSFTVCLVSGTYGRTNSVDKDVISRLDALEREGHDLRLYISRQDELLRSLDSVVQSQAKVIDDLQAKVGNQEVLIAALLKEQHLDQEKVSSDDHERGSEVISTKGGPSLSIAANAEKRHTQGRMEYFSGIRKTRMLFEGPVAFQARIDKFPVQHLGVNQNIVFDVVVTNIGGAYHPNHGVFIAPSAGIYIFSTSVLTEHAPHQEYQASLMKNGTVLARAYGHADSGHDQGSITAVTPLVAGEEVWVSLRGPSDDSIWGDGFTSFTGCLVMNQ